MVILQIPLLNLDKIYKSYYSPRWIKLRDGKYILINEDKAVKVEQKRERFAFNCSEDEFFQIWFPYLDLSYDYAEAYYKSEIIDKDLKEILVRAKGIRNIKHPLLESIYGVAMLRDNSSWNNSLEFLANKCGTVRRNSMREAGKVKWFSTPTLESICKNKEVAKNFPFLDLVSSRLFHAVTNQDNLSEWPKKKLALFLIECGFTKEEVRLIFSLALGTNSVIENEKLEGIVQNKWQCDWTTFSEWFLSGENSFLIAQCLLWDYIENKEE